MTDPRIATALAPLPADAPDPASFREMPEFDALDSQIRKLEREGPGAVAWPDIVSQAQTVLATRSKDLSVAVWLAAGLANIEGLPGLAVGLAILRGLVDQQWDTLFPPKTRARARSGALQWMAARAARTIPAPPLVDQQAAAAVQAWGELRALDQLLVDKLPPDGVSLTDLVRPLRALADEAQRQQAAQPPAAAPAVASTAAPPSASAPSTPTPAPTPTPPATAAPPAPVSVPPVGSDPEKSLSALREAVRSAALTLLEANLAEFRAFGLLRAVTWLAVTDPPPAGGGRTAIMPPPEQREAEFAALRGAGNLPDLVLSLERYCSGSGIFWLDGHRIAAASLAEMGPRYAACVGAIVQGVAALLARLPTLPDLAFSNGRPFADAATRAWIATVVAPPAGNGTANADTEPWKAGLADARKLLLEGKAEAGLQALVTARNAVSDGRSRFFWGLAQARFCIEAGATSVALPILRDLDRWAARHEVETWEPLAVAELSKLLYDCVVSSDLAKMLPEGDRSRAIETEFERLARLDPIRAIRTTRT